MEGEKKDMRDNHDDCQTRSGLERDGVGGHQSQELFWPRVNRGGLHVIGPSRFEDQH